MAAAPPPQLQTNLSRRMFVSLEVEGRQPAVVSYRKLLRRHEEAAADAAEAMEPEAEAEPAEDAGGATGDSDAEEAGEADDEEEAEEGDAEDSDGEARSGSPERKGARDAYDLADPFVDDSEHLEEEAGRAKHTGYFTNKGEVEREQLTPGKRVVAEPVKKRKKPRVEDPARDVLAGETPGAGSAPAAVRPKNPAPPYTGEGPLGQAVRELEVIVSQAPLPPADQKLRRMTAAMLEGLEKIKQLLVPEQELPRGLTTKLATFMDPFASIGTLRHRLRHDLDGPPREAPAPTSLPAAAMAPSPALPQLAKSAVAVPGPAPVPAPRPRSAPKARVPVSETQAETDLASLRAAVSARLRHLQGDVGVAEQPSSDFQSTQTAFKWDRTCEEALAVVVANNMSRGMHKAPACDAVAGMDVWPPGVVDGKALLQAYTRVCQRRQRQTSAAAKPA